MEIQIMRVRGSKLMKRMANKQFKNLCADYNRIYTIIDTLKNMLKNGLYEQGTSEEIPNAIQAVLSVYTHSVLVDEDLEKTVEELEKRLRAIEEVKENYMISNPLAIIRIEHMTNLVIYLREMRKEVMLIVAELEAIIKEIERIEESEFYY